MRDSGNDTVMANDQTVGIPRSRRGASDVLSRPRRVRTILLNAVLAAGSLAWWANPASAHDRLVGSAPAAQTTVSAAPAVVRLFFEEPPVAGYTRVAVLDPHGRRIDNGTISGQGSTITVPLRKTTVRGNYTISYRVLSDDGHVVNGRIEFRVGRKAVNSVVGSTHQTSPSLAIPAIAVAIGALGLGTTHVARRSRRSVRASAS